MSKRKADDSGKRKKYSELTGFSKDITPTRLKKLRSHPHKGDWRRDRMIRISTAFFLLLMFHLFLDLLKKVVKNMGCYFFKKGGEVRVGGMD